MSAALRPLPGVGVVVEGPRHHKGGRVCAGNHHDCDDDGDDCDDYCHDDRDHGDN